MRKLLERDPSFHDGDFMILTFGERKRKAGCSPGTYFVIDGEKNLIFIKLIDDVAYVHKTRRTSWGSFVNTFSAFDEEFTMFIRGVK
jgi:hypothetical protein